MIPPYVEVEGHVEVRGQRCWYGIAGAHAPGLPLVLVHGGPGSPHDKFESFAALANERPVVFYDQLGCGRSDRPADPAFYSVSLFLEELAALRAHLGLEQIHLFGSSWGGMLALEHVLSGAQGIRSLLLASTPFDMQLWQRELRQLIAALPWYLRRAIDGYELGGHDTQPPPQSPPRPITQARIRRLRRLWRIARSRPAGWIAYLLSFFPATRRLAYELGSVAFVSRHGCRLASPPDCVFAASIGRSRMVYETLWGPSEFFGTGPLAHWRVTERLGAVRVPALILSGAHDEATPAQMRCLHEAIPGSRWALFPNSSHMAYIEEPEAFFGTLRGFLHEVEAERAGASLGV